MRDIGFASLCEHHLLPFVGHVNVAYLPGKHIVGLSKIPRIVGVFGPEHQASIRFRLAESLRAILAQRLVPRKNGRQMVAAVEERG